MRVLAIVILMGLNLATALMLESKVGAFYWVELLLILVAMGVIGVQFLAMWLEAEWSYPLATILFSLSLVNLLWLYSSVSWFKVFAAGVVFNLLGIIISSVGVKKEDEQELETYDDEEPEEDIEEYEEEKPKRGRKKKR
ncbi:hypothetical protein DRJ22_00850 [Candidatus Woesearchaeota archaeon]|nr:MAG: hypothetical protein B6U93_00635 [Candidatus Woesearchaeota archaeon ex4484_78]RLE46847.1 MAG: hypothetical protein DRJ22_00850 [Candidatus Woesearchaeota archaeon]